MSGDNCLHRVPLTENIIIELRLAAVIPSLVTQKLLLAAISEIEDLQAFLANEQSLADRLSHSINLLMNKGSTGAKLFADEAQIAYKQARNF